MKTHDKKSLTILAACLLCVFVLGVVGIAMMQRRAQEQEIPRVISKVKSLEVMSVKIVRDGDPTTALAIEIRNKSEKPVIAFSVESGDDKDASGIDINGMTSDEPPTTVIEPYGTRTVELPMGDVHPGKIVKVAGAIYADQSEDGDELSLRSIHQHQKRDKAETLKRKGGLK
jgi:hypothetical protein